MPWLLNQKIVAHHPNVNENFFCALLLPKTRDLHRILIDLLFLFDSFTLSLVRFVTFLPHNISKFYLSNVLTVLVWILLTAVWVYIFVRVTIFCFDEKASCIDVFKVNTCLLFSNGIMKRIGCFVHWWNSIKKVKKKNKFWYFHYNLNVRPAVSILHIFPSNLHRKLP